jgi:hypothetical protein
MPTTKMGLASAGMLVGLVSSAALGGKLVYDYSIGVQRMGAGVEERKLMFGSGGVEKKAQ